MTSISFLLSVSSLHSAVSPYDQSYPLAGVLMSNSSFFHQLDITSLRYYSYCAKENLWKQICSRAGSRTRDLWIRGGYSIHLTKRIPNGQDLRLCWYSIRSVWGIRTATLFRNMLNVAKFPTSRKGRCLFSRVERVWLGKVHAQKHNFAEQQEGLHQIRNRSEGLG